MHPTHALGTDFQAPHTQSSERPRSEDLRQHQHYIHSLYMHDIQIRALNQSEIF